MLIAESQSITPVSHLQVVKAPRKARVKKDPFDGHPFRGIAIPIIHKKKCICWQLRLCFEQKLEPLQPKKKLKGWQIPENETPYERHVREEKGRADRDKFMREVGNPAKYENMRFMAKSAIMAALNKSSTLRGLPRHQEDEITMEFLHATIDKVSRLLELGTKKSDNVCGYCYTFIEKDAARYIHKLDVGNFDIHFDDDNDDDDTTGRSSSAGSLALSIADIPSYMEGHPKEFAEFLHDYVFDWAGRNLPTDTESALDVRLFTLYFGSGKTIMDIREMTGHSKHRIVKAIDTFKRKLLANISLAEIQEQFGRKIMGGCNCD